MKAGDVLVPRETPAGPPEAREAWAHELGQLLVVVDVRGQWVQVNAPTTGETVGRALHEIAAEFELAGIDHGRFGRPWSSSVVRAADAAARVDAATFGGRESPDYWQRVVATVRRVLREEDAA